jgi:ubiquinone/menaquinone biosynthesis C-methylase UbiE
MTKSYRDMFKGTAWYYARYRANYPDVFFDMLKNKFNLSKNDRVLDLGCGTGQIAIPICKYVKEVVAMDPEPEMLFEGKILAEKSMVSNIKWLEGGSADLIDMKSELGKFRLAVLGTAFHWMNREKTLDDLFEMLNDGGSIVIANLDNTIFKKPEIVQVVKKWLGEERRAGSGLYQPPAKRHEEVIKESKFHNLEFWTCPLVFSGDIDGIIGNLYSSSMANPKILGAKKEAFESDLRNTLLKDNPSGQFVSEGRVQVFIAYK